MLAAAIKDAHFISDTTLVRTLTSLTNAVLESILSDVQSEAIQGTAELHQLPLLRTIHAKFNRTSPADHNALELK